jgi:hypothetical protein
MFPYEHKVLEYLEQEFAIEDRQGLEQSLDLLRKSFQKIINSSNGELRAGHVVILGFINHAHHLLVGGLRSVLDGNGPLWSLCVRALMETFGACVLILERPQTAPNYLTIRGQAGKYRSAAERVQPGLAKDIRRLDEIAHPGSRAILAGFHVADVEKRMVNIVFGLSPPAASEAREGVRVLANLAVLISDNLARLSTLSDVLLSGGVIVSNRLWFKPLGNFYSKETRMTVIDAAADFHQLQDCWFPQVLNLALNQLTPHEVQQAIAWIDTHVFDAAVAEPTGRMRGLSSSGTETLIGLGWTHGKAS